LTERKTVSLEDRSSSDRYFKSKGSIPHHDAELLYVLRSEGGLEQYLEIYDKKTMKRVNEIDLREQNFPSMHSNQDFIATVYRKGASEVQEKSTWDLRHEFKYNNNVGVSAFMTDDILLVALYSARCGIYFYNDETGGWTPKGISSPPWYAIHQCVLPRWPSLSWRDV
jgi:hypothetical protein